MEQLAVATLLVEYRHEGIDAEAVAYQIKQRFPDQRIILLSAYADMPERVLWLMDDYVMRGEPLERMAEVLESVTHQKRREAVA